MKILLLGKVKTFEITKFEIFFEYKIIRLYLFKLIKNNFEILKFVTPNFALRALTPFPL